MESAQGMTWKKLIREITGEFLSWGCRYSRKQLPEIAMGYDCSPLYFWNWMDDPEAEKTERIAHLKVFFEGKHAAAPQNGLDV